MNARASFLHAFLHCAWGTRCPNTAAFFYRLGTRAEQQAASETWLVRRRQLFLGISLAPPFCEVIMEGVTDYSAWTTADLRRLDELSTELVDVVMARLRAGYPQLMDELFPPDCVIPNLTAAASYGGEVLTLVRQCAEAGCSAILARRELGERKYIQ